MNIIFFGSSKFAVPALEEIINAGYKISCVVTQPDRKKGRGLHMEGTEVKKMAQSNGLKIYQPQRINTSEATGFLKNLSPDLFLVISYGQILSQEILDIPKLLAINAHASLLPKYRGASPVSRSIINGDKQTGVTIMKMAKDMDAGPVILQEKINIEDSDTIYTLEEKLSVLATDLVIEALELIKGNKYKLIPQDDKQVSFAPKLKKEDGLIDWSRPAGDISNLIRGCFSWPGAFTYHKGKMLKIYSAEVTRLQNREVSATGGFAYGETSSPGKVIIVDKHQIIVSAGKDSLIIKELQIEGKRRMTAQEFISGHKIKQGDSLG